MTKDEQRILRRIHVKPTGCHGWYGCVDSSGYPTAMAAGKNVKIHRWLFARANPTVNIQGKWVAQGCLDKGCLNVEHMDVRNKPHRWLTKKLNADLCRKIRNLPEGTNVAAYARQIGVARSTVRRVMNNETWRE